MSKLRMHPKPSQGFNERRGVGVEMLDPFATEKRKKSVSLKRNLSGHFSKVLDLQWCKHPHKSRHLLTASADGKLLLWDGLTKNKLHMVNLNGPWVVTCAISPSGRVAAAGGFDNNCALYSIPTDENSVPRLVQKLPHTEYVSRLRFIDEHTVATSCGDKSIRVWDLETGKCLTVLNGHQRAVTSVAVFRHTTHLVSASFDQTAKIWDVRIPNTCRTLHCHEGDVNTAEWFPDGQAIGTGGEDGSCKLFDLRNESDVFLNAMKCPGGSGEGVGVKSLAFSNTGRVLFAGHEDGVIYGWDLQREHIVHTMAGHSSTVTSIDISADGSDLASCSFDSTVAIWG